MPTLAAIRARLIEDLGIGQNIVIAEIATGSSGASALVSQKWFGNANHNSNHYISLNTGIHRPGAASSADYWRKASTLTPASSTLAPDAAWADTTWSGETEVNLIHYGIHYQEIDDAINRSMEDIYFPNEVFLSLFPDGDMQSTSTSSWTTSNSSISKVTTAVRSPFGIRSLRVQNSDANGYAQSGTLKVKQGDMVYIFAIASVDAGPDANLVLYDVTNSAAFGTAVETAEESPTLMWRKEAVPATCKEFAVRLLGESASSDIYWNQLGGYRVNDRRLFLPSTFDESFKIMGLASAEFTNGGNTNGTADALSIYSEEIPRSDYSFLYSNPQANPYAVQFHNPRWLGKPIIIQGRRPYSDMGALSAESDTTTAPLHLAVAAAAVRLLMPPSRRAAIPRGEELFGQALAVLQSANKVRPAETPARKSSPGTWGVVMN